MLPLTFGSSVREPTGLHIPTLGILPSPYSGQSRTRTLAGGRHDEGFVRVLLADFAAQKKVGAFRRQLAPDFLPMRDVGMRRTDGHREEIDDQDLGVLVGPVFRPEKQFG